MTTQHDKSKRWRPQFSVRTLVILVTLVCAYAACWVATKNQGIENVYNHTVDNGAPEYWKSSSMLGYRDASATAPLVVGINRLPYDDCTKREYYVWFFGHVAKLPYERELPMQLRKRPAS